MERDVRHVGAAGPVEPALNLHTTPCRYYMNVSYVPAAEEQPVCKGWIEKPAYLLQVRYAYVAG